MSDDKPLNEIELTYQAVGPEGYVVRTYTVSIKSHDSTVDHIITKADEQLDKLIKISEEKKWVFLDSQIIPIPQRKIT